MDRKLGRDVAAPFPFVLPFSKLSNRPLSLSTSSSFLSLLYSLTCTSYSLSLLGRKGEFERPRWRAFCFRRVKELVLRAEGEVHEVEEPAAILTFCGILI